MRAPLWQHAFFVNNWLSIGSMLYYLFKAFCKDYHGGRAEEEEDQGD